MLHHVEQLRRLAPEVLAQIGTGLDRVLLILAVDDLPHPLHQQTVFVLREQRIEILAPQNLDDVPSGAAEHDLELLNDLAVATHWTIEPLQIAVDDEDEVVELFA